MTDATQHTLPALYDSLAATGLVRRLLELARDEDLGPLGRDLTGELLPADTADTRATVNAREAGTVAGLAAIPDLLDVFGASLEAELHTADGLQINPGDPILTLTGPLVEIVRVERTLLNLLGRLSGIATRTRGFADIVADRAKLLDTRKTTPGLRILEKYAVVCGGGHTHRLGLHDAVLIKDNHIAGLEPDRLTAFVEQAAEHGRAAGAAFIEIETDTLAQLAAVLACPPGTIDHVLLDNMTTDEMLQAVDMRNQSGSGVRLEASGGVTLDTIGSIAETGVDRISVGSLTHAARSLDFGLDRGPQRA